MITISIVLAVVIFFSAIIALILGKTISRPIRMVAAILKTLSSGEGDLSNRLLVLSKNEVGDLSMNYNIFLDRLSQIVLSINNTMVEAVNLKEIMNNATQETFSALHQISTNASSMNTQMHTMDETTEKASQSDNRINGNILTLDRSIENQSSAVEESTASVKQMVTSLQMVTTIPDEKNKITKQLTETSSKGKRKVEDTRKDIKSISDNIGTINECRY